MVAPIRVTPMFAVPFGHDQYADHVRLNRELEALFLARETEEVRNHSPSHIPQAETFESRFNLFRWPDQPVQELRRFMLDGVARTVLETTTLTPADLSRMTFQNHTWFHLSRYGGGFINHNHPLASWSAVYCVRAGEAPAEYPDSGMLRFFDPRVGADGYQDGATAPQKRPFLVKPVELRLAEGQLVVFPSYMFHEVTPFYGRDVRITVATNCWFT